jgi:hypothetical protein
MNQILQLKHIEWLSGFKKKAEVYIDYKKLTSPLRTYLDWQWRNRIRHSMQMESKRKRE